ncbi:hypothetical protein HDC92_004088 [Pedobacter sp. AK017]|uniref:hypothetical protein n=1 Tax=Pedobacter sp. AK017 TaxID=2723073 RepID=UPI00160A7FF8|nr:hypothetical protein [Pedobacter sp. AK017]MBB5440387.1 hypothetical protein [Pedobacter sp. AK017]
MGIKSVWQSKVVLALEETGLYVEHPEHEIYQLLLCNQKVVLHLVPLENNYDPAGLIALQTEYKAIGKILLHLWEDVWLTRQVQVLGRICSLLGINKRLHARKAKIRVLTQKQAADFMDQHHLQASARARYKFALCIDEKIVAVACFSALRSMKNISATHKSAELIRFASLTGFTITGGFSKLLKHFITLMQPDDVMSYADRDWSLGNAYAQSGFVLKETTAPAKIWLNKNELCRYFEHRLPADAVSCAADYVQIYNTGNLKYILYL